MIISSTSFREPVLREHGGSGWQESWIYTDGGGNVIQTKVQAAPGEAPSVSGGTVTWSHAEPRYIGTGRTVLDNKGKVVKMARGLCRPASGHAQALAACAARYEPFFSTTSDYEDEDELVEWGKAMVLDYDPIGRNTAVTLPDGSVRSWSYAPWRVEAFDEEDNKTGGDHEGTPALTHLDALGRVYKGVQTPDGTAEHTTALELDILGNVLTVTDPRGNPIQVRRYDLLGRPAFTGAADEGYDGSSGDGETTAFFAADSQPAQTWRSGGLTLRQSFDVLRRPVGLWVDEGAGERLVERNFYGDALSDALPYSLGRPVRVYDTAGEVQLAYDFRGRVTEQSRTVIEDITVEADWAGLDSEESLADLDTWVEANAGLDDETFTVTTAYDALDRPTEQTAPDDSRTVPTYDEGGRLSAVEVFVRGAGTATSFVEQITTNARGQREKIVYGNHTETAYTYDEDRLWLTRLRTDRSSSSTHGAAKLQDLSFERDLVGNLTQIDDDAQETVFFSNAQVSPERGFVYDSLYRLVSATGREKTGQGQSTAFYQDYAGGPGGIPDAGNPALRRYTQSYVYDAAGNILETKHQQGTFGSVLWRRGYAIEAENNQLVSTSLPGDDPDDPGTHSQSYAYSARGAMVFMPHLKPGVSANLVRDFRDQIRKAELDEHGNVAWYAYDASGERVRKVWDKGSVVEERIYVGGYEVWRKRNGSGDVEEERQTLHVMDDEQRIAMVETLTVTGGSEVGSPTPRVRYQLGDHLGTALLEVDGDGGVISYEEYHPYGTTACWAEASAIEVSTKRYRYTGKERDEETGLQYHSARYYAPWLGRWERADPIGLTDGVNRFAYVRGKPSCSQDASGLSPEPPPLTTGLMRAGEEPVEANPDLEVPIGAKFFFRNEQLDIRGLLEKERSYVVNELLPEALVLRAGAAVHEISPDRTTLLYDAANTVPIRGSSRSYTGWHCTELVFNSAFDVGFDVHPTKSGYWLPTSHTIDNLAGASKLVGGGIEVIWQSSERGFTNQTWLQVRRGDILLYGPPSGGSHGHQAIIDSRYTYTTGSEKPVREHYSKRSKHELGPVQPDFFWVVEAGIDVGYSERSAEVAGRKSAIYRFTAIDDERIQTMFENDPDYRKLLIEAFKRTQGP